ncbi:hypothetical protein AVEN_63967-1 [Araneus ventricosus]|uniref:Uncharacterized protein n=1 Tax=Araneus ventricosus TaxID=182803 RepID=A0A4Y2KA06_ARAVE|nr:hypothetical protein AVEN_63967-1 [Araneus ventricosus]
MHFKPEGVVSPILSNKSVIPPPIKIADLRQGRAAMNAQIYIALQDRGKAKGQQASGSKLRQAVDHSLAAPRKPISYGHSDPTCFSPFLYANFCLLRYPIERDSLTRLPTYPHRSPFGFYGPVVQMERLDIQTLDYKAPILIGFSH